MLYFSASGKLCPRVSRESAQVSASGAFERREAPLVSELRSQERFELPGERMGREDEHFMEALPPNPLQICRPCSSVLKMSLPGGKRELWMPTRLRSSSPPLSFDPASLRGSGLPILVRGHDRVPPIQSHRGAPGDLCNPPRAASTWCWLGGIGDGGMMFPRVRRASPCAAARTGPVTRAPCWHRAPSAASWVGARGAPERLSQHGARTPPFPSL